MILFLQKEHTQKITFDGGFVFLRCGANHFDERVWNKIKENPWLNRLIDNGDVIIKIDMPKKEKTKLTRIQIIRNMENIDELQKLFDNENKKSKYRKVIADRIQQLADNEANKEKEWPEQRE